MNTEHLLLIVLWIGYCAAHTLLAGTKVKNYLQKIMSSQFKYYRPAYSIFATVTLALILWFQYSIQSNLLLAKTAVIYLPAIMLSLAGLTIMIICINKYFYELSGLQAIQHSQVKNTLQQSGLHKYVRHPLYSGTLLFIWGLFLIFPFMSNLIPALIITVYVLFGINIEEKKLRIEYGESYSAYAKSVPKLIPHFYTNKKGSV